MSKKNELELLQKYIDSNYSDYNTFTKLCKFNLNLTGYLCISKEELTEVCNKLSSLKTDNVKDKYEYLVENQPIINSTVQIYEEAVKLLTDYLKKYVNYHAYKLINAQGDIEDYIQDLYQKFFYMTNFYKIRWFEPNTLKKATKVKWKPMTYKEFSYIARATIAGERRLKAYKFAINPEATTNKISLSQLAYSKTPADNKSLKREDLIETSETLVSACEYSSLIQRISEQADAIDGGKYSEKIKSMLFDNQVKGNKLENVIFKVCLYKGGVTNSLKLLNFINSLSTKYKEKFGISQTLLENQISEANMNEITISNLAQVRTDEYYEWRERQSAEWRKEYGDK